MKKFCLKQRMFLLCVPFILFSSYESKAQDYQPIEPTSINDTYEAIQEYVRTNTAPQPVQEVINEIEYLLNLLKGENYAQVYSFLEKNKNKLNINNQETLKQLQELQDEVEKQYQSKNHFLNEVKKLNALLRDVKQGRADYSAYVNQAKALQKKNKQLIIEKNNGFLAIDTSVTDKLKQDVGDLKDALAVLKEVCNGVCKNK